MVGAVTGERSIIVLWRSFRRRRWKARRGGMPDARATPELPFHEFHGRDADRSRRSSWLHPDRPQASRRRRSGRPWSARKKAIGRRDADRRATDGVLRSCVAYRLLFPRGIATSPGTT